MTSATFDGSYEGWRNAARGLIAADIPPHEVDWIEAAGAQRNLFAAETQEASGAKLKVPRAFANLAPVVALHSNGTRWSLLYRALWRLTHAEARLLEIPTDEDVVALNHFANEVRKDAYRMRAFLRFRETKLEGEPWFVAWYEPEHDTVAFNEDFFVARFANMRWSILTPKRSMHYDGANISFSPGAEKPAIKDDAERLWITYYSSIFNPARIKPAAMQAQLLKRNWKNLPEAVVIEPLLREARKRSDTMIERSDFLREDVTEWGAIVPRDATDLPALKNAVASCRGCPLWKSAACAVFGEGPANARVVLVGEQPGDQEDRAGRPFVGPAGQLLERALAAAGARREDLYVTNAVKHFKFEPRGKRRIHKTASAREIAACRPWLAAELGVLKPQLIVALGATAAQSLCGERVKVTDLRGTIVQSEFGSVLITVHPSSLLRLVESPERDFAVEFERFVADLRQLTSR